MKRKIEITDEMQKAMELMETSNTPIYITGKAGTGKTTLLKYITNHTKYQYVITAPTGVAAVNAGGVTLHSLFQIPFGPYCPNSPVPYNIADSKKELLEQIELLIIDEISMVRPDILDFVDKRLRTIRFSNEPFGGVQVVMLGDLFQLPPVVPDNEGKILSKFYKSPYFYEAKVFDETEINIIELNHVFRQTDKAFIELLNRIREYSLEDSDWDKLDELKNNKTKQYVTDNHISICAFRIVADRINKKRLGKATHIFTAKITDDFPKSNAPCDQILKLRIGAKVMTLINDPSGDYYNGSIGTVKEIPDKDTINITLDNGKEVSISKAEWTNYEYKLNDEGKVEKVKKGSLKQFPLALAWAITVHKSQGLTFDNVAVNVAGAFCPGQVYVALSRCRSWEGLASSAYISKKHIIPDNNLIEFTKQYRENGGVYKKAK